MEKSSFDARQIKIIDNSGYQPTLMPAFVLLGMLDDYLGRAADWKDSVVERFYPKEQAVSQLFLRYIADLAMSGTAGAPEVNVTSTGHIQVLSKAVKTYLDAFYSAPLPETPWPGRTSRHLLLSAFPTITSRQYLPAEVDPRFSYLYGVYLRYGDDEPYKFVLANSSDRVEVIKEFLVELDAEWASHRFTIKTAPVRNEVAFGPNKTLAQLAHRAIEERREMRSQLGERA